MARIITCTCGSQVGLPENSGNRVFRCPVCKKEISLPNVSSGSSLPQVTTSTTASGTCPVCQSGIASHEAIATCPQCRQVHHQECWNEVGGCGTYGCEKAPKVEKEAADIPLTAWGETKVCPVCKETIKAIAVMCRYCNTQFETVDPLSLRDVLRKDQRRESAKGLRQTIVCLFILSLVGLLAPLVALIGPLILWRRRKDLAKESPVFLVLGYAAVGLSSIYTLLFLIFLLK